MREPTPAEGRHIACHDIGTLVDAALEDRFEAALLDLVAARLGGVAVLYYRQDHTRPAACGILHRGLGGGAMPVFPSQLAIANPLFEEHRRKPVGAVFDDGALMPRARFRETEFYRDWLSRAGDFDAATGIVISRDGPVQTVLEIRYPAHAARQLAPEAGQFLNEMALYLSQAARIVDVTARMERRQAEARSFLELSGFPTFIVDPSCRILAMNARGDGMLRRNRGLSLGMDRCLQAIAAKDTALLQDRVAQISLSAAMHGSFLGLDGGADKTGLVLSLTPLSALGPVDLGHGPGGAAPGQVAIVAVDGAEGLQLGRDALWAMFDLTAREAELALALLQGRTLPELSRTQAVSKQTLRNQLSSILRKTGTTRQADLIALLLQMARALPL